MSKMAVMGTWTRTISLALVATLSSWGHAAVAAEPPYEMPGQFESIPAPDAAYNESIPAPDATYHQAPWEGDITDNYLAEDMAQAMAQHGGVRTDGSTYSEDPLGPCDYLGKGLNCPPEWYTEQQVRVFTRTRSRATRLSIQYLPDESAEAGTAIGEDRMGTKSFVFDGTEGYYTTIGRHVMRDSKNRDHFAEFTFWGFNSWEQWSQVSAPKMSAFGFTFGSLISPFGRSGDIFDAPVGGFNRSDTHLFNYQSSIHNWELNGRIRPRIRKDRLVLQPNGRWRREERSGAHYSFLYGFRTLRVKERSRFQARGELTDGVDTFSNFGDYYVRTGNNLVGLQIGGDMIYRYNTWQWGFRGKAGAFVNSAHHVSRISSGGTDPFAAEFPNHRLAASRSSLAGVIEFGATAKYMITPNFWLTGSYDLMWVTGLALAPEQMKFDPIPSRKLNSGGTVFYHGLTAGFECVF